MRTRRTCRPWQSTPPLCASCCAHLPICASWQTNSPRTLAHASSQPFTCCAFPSRARQVHRVACKGDCMQAVFPFPCRVARKVHRVACKGYCTQAVFPFPCRVARKGDRVACKGDCVQAVFPCEVARKGGCMRALSLMLGVAALPRAVGALPQVVAVRLVNQTSLLRRRQVRRLSSGVRAFA